MFIAQHTIETNASVEAIWNIWRDVKSWRTWDPATEYGSLKGNVFIYLHTELPIQTPVYHLHLCSVALFPQ